MRQMYVVPRFSLKLFLMLLFLISFSLPLIRFLVIGSLQHLKLTFRCQRAQNQVAHHNQTGYGIEISFWMVFKHETQHLENSHLENSLFLIQYNFPDVGNGYSNYFLWVIILYTLLIAMILGILLGYMSHKLSVNFLLCTFHQLIRITSYNI